MSDTEMKRCRTDEDSTSRVDPVKKRARTDVDLSSVADTSRLGTKFCRRCGATRDGNTSPCPRCPYRKNVMSLGCIVEHENKVLLCKRTDGCWALPADYLRLGRTETRTQIVIGEVWERTKLEVEIVSPLCLLETPPIDQRFMVFVAKLKNPNSSIPESLDFKFFLHENIPFSELAYSSTSVALKLYFEDKKKRGCYGFHHLIFREGPADV